MFSLRSYRSYLKVLPRKTRTLKEAVRQRQGKHFGQNDRNKVEKEYKNRLTAVSPSHQRKVLLVEAKINGQSKLCIVDTGASISLISKDVWESLKSNDAPLQSFDIVAEAANNLRLQLMARTGVSRLFRGFLRYEDCQVPPAHCTRF